MWEIKLEVYQVNYFYAKNSYLQYCTLIILKYNATYYFRLFNSHILC